MQTQPNKPTQVILPVTQTQLPLNQNEEAIKSAEEKKVKYFKEVVRRLGITTIILSVLVFLMSIAEVAIKVCREERVYNYDYDALDGYHYLSIQCFPYISWGVGIWCSVLPFVAGIFGVIAGSKSTTQKKNGLLMGFSIVGACMCFVLLVLQSILTVVYRYETRNHMFKFGLQIAIMCTTGINMVILITSSAYSCCLCKCCCGKSKRPVEQQVVYTYASNYPIQQVSNQPIPGTLSYPQPNQLVMTNLQPNQIVMTNSQPNQIVMTNVKPNQQVYTNQSFQNTEPPHYNQVSTKAPM